MKSIMLNTTKGKYLKSLSDCLSSKPNFTYLFLITKNTEGYGSYLDSDFVLLKFDIQTNEDVEMKLKPEIEMDS